MQRDETQTLISSSDCRDVQVSEGILRGRIEADVQVFKGIPYALPPVGSLRFRAPEPPDRWTGVRSAMRFAEIAPQLPDPGFFPGDPDAMPRLAMSEDCLHLNIWAPVSGGPHPVLIWLHGGSQLIGGTARPVYDGAVFARAGIVCVTVGFRLGALGYLELGDLLGAEYEGSGNNALADQLAAICWVRDNIEAFGGDAGRVTLGGESAGAKNIAALMASPAAEGLFHAAIAQSGGGDTVHDVADAQEVARRFLAAADLDARNLLKMSPTEVLAVQQRLLTEHRPRFPFRPIYGTGILPQRPVDGIRRNLAGRHALLIGTSRDEFGPHISDEVLSAGWRANLLAHHTPEEMAAIEARAGVALQGFSSAKRRAQLLMAEGYWVPSIRMADANASKEAPTWMYRFDLALPSGPLAGKVPHTADLAPGWARPSPYDCLAGRPAARMQELVANFVHTHRTDWPAYKLMHRTTALIGENLNFADHPGALMLELFTR